MKFCTCGAAISPRARTARCRRCACRLANARYKLSAKSKAAQARYGASAKGRARQARYRLSDKRTAAQARYRNSAKGKATLARANASRVFIGERYGGRVQTPEHAAVINAHVKERICEFIARQQAGT